MKYRWKKFGEDDYDEGHVLYLILDDGKYEFADISWQFDMERWTVFVAGFVSEETLSIEKHYELLSDAKHDVLTYAKVWWVTGAMQRMNEDEKRQWREMATT
jgi:two-component SAPR family response regulator